MQVVYEDKKYCPNGLKYRIYRQEESGVDKAGFLVAHKSKSGRPWNGGVRYDTINQAIEKIFVVGM